MRILEEFWYSNIRQTKCDTSFCTEYEKQPDLICRNKEKLRVTMTDEQEKLFETGSCWRSWTNT